MAYAETVRQMYEAFGRGDISSILAALAEDVEWEYGEASTDVPWLQPRRGRAAVAGFFEALGALDFHSFQPKTLLEAGPIVVALIDNEEATLKTFRREGNMVRLDPANRNYQAQRYDPRRVQIQGRLAGLIRRY